MHLHVAKAKSRAVTREASQKYDVTNIKIAVIYFENFFSTFNFSKVLYIIKQHQRNQEIHYVELYNNNI